MKKGVVSFVAILTLAACRGVLGIEELAVETEAGTDGSTPTAEAGADAPGDASTYAMCRAMGMECQKCCRDNYKQEGAALEQYGKMSGCLCAADGGGCNLECNPGVCGGGGPPLDGGGACGPCSDPLLRSSSLCDGARKSCKADPSCRDLVQCWEGCL